MEIPPEDVSNVELFEFAKESLVCSLCKGILVEPHQCGECLSSFCLSCISTMRKKSNQCPIKKCNNFTIVRNEAVEQMLNKLKFKCRNGCDAIINYADLKKHYDTDCPKMNYGHKYLEEMSKVKYLKLQLKMKEKLLQKMKNNLEHIKDVDYFIDKMQHHPLNQTTDWNSYRNRMTNSLNQFRSFAEAGNAGNAGNAANSDPLNPLIPPAQRRINLLNDPGNPFNDGFFRFMPNEDFDL